MLFYRCLEEAVSISSDNIKTLTSEYLHIDNAFMRVAADNIATSIDVPNFDRSAVDGYAISQADMELLKTDPPLSLQVIATLKAGSIESKQIEAGKSYRIMTGALLPQGTAGVIKQEDVTIAGNRITAYGSHKQGENIQSAGHELKAGDKIVAQGQVIRAEILERIAACGIKKIPVYKIPRIYVIETGSELILPGLPIKPGQIYGSNRSLIAAKIAGNGAIPVLANSVVEDNLEAIVEEIKKAVRVSDMLIICGGTGNGDYDLVYKAFESLNARPLFRGINIIPGKGTSAALFKGKLLYNLSGNPNAAGLLFEVLIKPALLKLKGELVSNREWFDIPLGSPIKSIKQVRYLCRGEMIIKQGCIYAQPISKGDNSIMNMPLILDLQAGQGVVGDIIRARLY